MQANDLQVGRIGRSTDFERVLACRPCCRSAHFAAHHLAVGPSLGSRAERRAKANKLSTDAAPSCLQAVDELPPGAIWLGCVVPKRHARRSVTRNMIKRTISASIGGVASRLPAGLWVLRLRSPYDRRLFPSAASIPLRQAVAEELRLLLEGCAANPAAVRHARPVRSTR